MVGRHALVEIDDRQKVGLGLGLATQAILNIMAAEKLQPKIIFQQPDRQFTQ
jgi:hypothetical protein